MTTLGDVQRFLEEFAPLSLAEDWDNVGLLVGDSSSDVTSVLTCLTLTPDVADEAIARGVQLIVSHHPILFRPVQRITNETTEGGVLLRLVGAGIAVYSPHTSFDSAQQGINSQLADLFGLNDVAPLRPADECGEPTSPGAGRHGLLPKAIELSALLELTKQKLQIDNVQFVGEPVSKVGRVGVACGAAAEFMRDAKLAGCDALITGEARFHACLEARNLGIALVLPGHYATERPAVENLAEVLSSQVAGVTAIASDSETDPVQWA